MRLDAFAAVLLLGAAVWAFAVVGALYLAFDSGATAPASRPAALDVVRPDEIRDIDMALRYSRVDHDESCACKDVLEPCDCGSVHYHTRARDVVRRLGAPYRKPSGDYDIEAVR